MVTACVPADDECIYQEEEHDVEYTPEAVPDASEWVT